MLKKDLVFIISISMLLIAGTWGKVKLYTSLSEPEINSILYILLDNNIDSEKYQEKDKFSLFVDKTQVARAIKLIHSNGLPLEQFQNIGDVFNNQGIISSPSTERYRLTYALSQELEEALSHIDGVLLARVQLALAQTNDVGEVIHPASSGVFIKYQSSHNLGKLVPRIKQFVANGVNGLDYDGVTVVLFKAAPLDVTTIPLQKDDTVLYLIIGAILLMILLGGVAGGAWWYWYGTGYKSADTKKTGVTQHPENEDSLDTAWNVREENSEPTDDVETSDKSGEREEMESSDESGEREEMESSDEFEEREEMESSDESGEREEMESSDESGEREEMESPDEFGEREK